MDYMPIKPVYKAYALQKAQARSRLSEQEAAEMVDEDKMQQILQEVCSMGTAAGQFLRCTPSMVRYLGHATKSACAAVTVCLRCCYIGSCASYPVPAAQLLLLLCCCAWQLRQQERTLTAGQVTQRRAAGEHTCQHRGIKEQGVCLMSELHDACHSGCCSMAVSVLRLTQQHQSSNQVETAHVWCCRRDEGSC